MPTKQKGCRNGKINQEENMNARNKLKEEKKRYNFKKGRTMKRSQKGIKNKKKEFEEEIERKKNK